MSVRSMLSRINESDKQALLFAFEHELPHCVVLSDGSFIGVNITTEPQLVVKETSGPWFLGIVKVQKGEKE